MKKYLIFVEGKADIVFIRDYLLFLYENLSIEIDNQKEKQLKSDKLLIKIIVSGGYSTIKKKLQTRLTEIKDFNYKILIIQDADNPQKQDGGVENRTIYLNNIKTELKTDFDIFLFPNNQNDGDLETLLLQIVKREQFDKSHSCYKQYALCSRKIAQEEHYNELLEDKHIIFNYFRAFWGMKDAKEENRVFSPDFWEFEHTSLVELKKVIDKFIDIMKRRVGKGDLHP